MAVVSAETSDIIFFVLFAVVGLMSVMVISLFIFMIIKFKKLRQETTNVIFLHYNIFEIAISLGLLFIRNYFYCATSQILVSALFGKFEIIWLLICDSYIKIYWANKYERFSRVCKYLLIGIYVLTVGTPFFLTPWCTSDEDIITVFYFVAMLGLGLLVLVLIIFNIVHAIRKRKLTNYKSSNIGLVVPNIFFLVLCPTLIIFFFRYNIGEVGPLILAIFCLFVGMNPIFNLIYVYFFDSDYKMLLKLCFTCKCGEYDSVNLEDPSVRNGVNFVNGGIQLAQE